MAVHFRVGWVHVNIEIGGEGLVFGVRGKPRQVIPLVLDLVANILLIFEVAESVVHSLDTLDVNLFVKFDLLECFLVELGKLG